MTLATAAAVATASVTGFPLAGRASAQSPSLSVSQSVSPTTVSAADQTATFSFAVTNTGDEELTAVSVGTTAFSGTGTPPVIACPATDLAPGASMTCTGPYTTTQADIDAGRVTSVGSATGLTPAGSTVTAPESTATLVALQSAALSLEKSAFEGGGDSGGGGGGNNGGGGSGNNGGGNNGSRRSTLVTFLTAGEVIDYSYLVTNTGNVTLTGVTVTDTSFSGTGTPPSISCPSTTLAPGASMTCSGSYTVTEADVNAGSITNTATATGQPPTGAPVTTPPSTSTVTGEQDQPGLVLDKIAVSDNSGGGGSSGGGSSGGNSRRNTLVTTLAAGQIIEYSFVVTNTGNVELADIDVTDTSFSGTGTPPVISCPSPFLAAGSSMTCTAAYTVTQADVDTGTITNTAVATGQSPTGAPITSPPATATVTVPQASLTLEKNVSVSGGGGGGHGGGGNNGGGNNGGGTGNGSGGNNGGGTNQRNTLTTTLAPGQSLDYSYVVTNTGAVTLTDVTVTDTSFSGAGTPPAISCPSTTLDPGASMTCTATYTVTQADIDAGTIANTAVATGQPPTGAPVTSSPDSATVTLTRSPALTLAKSASPTTVTAAGETVTYTFRITNTGNVTLTAPSVADTEFTGTGTAPSVSCPTGPLAPGATVVCTATYTVTAEDLDLDQIDNTAVATATGPESATVTSTPAAAQVMVTPSQSAPAPRPTNQPHPPAHHEPTGQLAATGTGSLTLVATACAVLLGAAGPMLFAANRRRRAARP
ncbi:hypothetical protein ACFV4P_18325 [Kitasatospora sp. NPDC059795]|uniref:DUF7507 domain-containing protein n=1 Tax=Kitasatospora sp. NPDC059795 TaxID=3346949 RepID=UPI003665FC81